MLALSQHPFFLLYVQTELDILVFSTEPSLKPFHLLVKLSAFQFKVGILLVYLDFCVGVYTEHETDIGKHGAEQGNHAIINHTERIGKKAYYDDAHTEDGQDDSEEEFSPFSDYIDIFLFFCICHSSFSLSINK